MNTGQPTGLSGEAFTGGLIRQHHSMLAVLHKLADILIIWGFLFGLAHAAQAEWTIRYQLVAFGSSLLFHVAAHKNSLYHSWRGQSLFAEVKAVFTVWAFIVGSMLTAGFLLNQRGGLNHFVMLEWVISVPSAISFYRVTTRLLLREMRRAGVNTRTVAIVGAKEPGLSLARSISNSPWMGLHIAGFFDDRVAEGETPLSASRNADERKLQVLGNISALKRMARLGTYDDIYIALPMKEEDTIRDLVESLADSPCNVHMVPDIFTFRMLNATSREIGGLPVLSVYNSPFNGFDAIIKRLEDIFASSIILCGIAIPMLIIAAAIKLSSPGPVIFKQRRYGINGEEIEVWKFRSMTCCEDGDIVEQVKRHDLRVTKIGRLLRRSSLDELPQFINVLQGRMSIVGPRPHAVVHNEIYRDQISGYMQRHLVKPGITGLAQVNGWRGETDTLEKMEKRVELDLAYIQNWSLWLDIKIIGSTLVKGFLGKSAY